jgi:hypothetical protein
MASTPDGALISPLVTPIGLSGPIDPSPVLCGENQHLQSWTTLDDRDRALAIAGFASGQAWTLDNIKSAMSTALTFHMHRLKSSLRRRFSAMRTKPGQRDNQAYHIGRGLIEHGH